MGNLEPQGIDLLLESLTVVVRNCPEVGLVIAGGRATDIQRYRPRTHRRGIGRHVHFVGPQPLSALRSFFNAADILVSPWRWGENTPIKIYSYLDSGKPLVATRVPAHTQVCDETMAILADPDPRQLAAALLDAIRNPTGVAVRAARAKAHTQARYSMNVFQEQVRELVGEIQKALEGGGS